MEITFTNDEELEEILNYEWNKRMHVVHPPWMVYCFKGTLPDTERHLLEKTAAGFRMHHSYGDGVALTCTFLPKVFNFVFLNEPSQKETQEIPLESVGKSELPATKSGFGRGKEFVSVDLEAVEELSNGESAPGKEHKINAGHPTSIKDPSMEQLTQMRATWFQEAILWLMGLAMTPYALLR